MSKRGITFTDKPTAEQILQLLNVSTPKVIGFKQFGVFKRVIAVHGASASVVR